jgi:hypothetical protein
MYEVDGSILRLCGHHGRQHQVALYEHRFRLVEAARLQEV